MSSLMEMMYTYTLRVNGHVFVSVSDSTGLIVGILVPVVVVFIILIAVIIKLSITLKHNKDSPPAQMEGLNSQPSA